MLHGVVEMGIEGFAQGVDLFDVQLFKGADKLIVGHLYAFDEIVFRIFGSLKGSFQVVDDGKKILYDVLDTVVKGLGLYFCGTFACYNKPFDDHET